MTENGKKEMKCQNAQCSAIVGKTDGVNLWVNDKLMPNKPLAMTYNSPACPHIVRWEAKGYKKQLFNKRR